VEKANDPQPARLLARPRCGFGRSGEEVTYPEDPANSGRPSRANRRRTSSTTPDTL